MEAITVIIPTYKRPELVKETVEHLQKNLVYAGDILYHVSSDDHADGSREALTGLATYYDGPAQGMGANLNFLLSTVETELCFQLDDDTFLVEPMDLNKHAQKLMKDGTVGVIRLGLIGGHQYIAKLEADQEINQAYWRIDWHSPEHYIASNRPHLKHKRWHEQMGLFPTGLPIGVTEEGFCHICKNVLRTRGSYTLGVLIPLDTITDKCWEHKGVISWNQQGI